MIILDSKNKKFPLGMLVMTPGVEANVSQLDIQIALNKYVQGDWGIIVESDKKLNDEALKVGDRLVAKYVTEASGTRKTEFYIITEWDRSVTTILLPEEY